MSLSASTSRLSYWTTTRSAIVARSIGAMSISGAAVTSIPPEWIDRWRGKPSMRAQNSSQRSQSDMPTVLPPRACGGASGSTRATDECGSARPRRSTPMPPRMLPSVGRRPRRAAARRSERLAGRVDRSAAAASPACRSPDRSAGPAPARRSRSRSRVAVPACPQPGDARRRVARAALVVRSSARPDRRRRLGRALPHPRPARPAAPMSAAPSGLAATRGRFGPPRVGRARALGSRFVPSHARVGSRFGCRGQPVIPLNGPGVDLGRSRRPTPSGRPPHRRVGAERHLRQPLERARRVGISGLRRLLPRRHLADERHALVELAHAVDEPVRLGLRGGGARRVVRARRGVTLARVPEELREATLGLEVAADHDAVVRLERLGDPVHQRPREPERRSRPRAPPSAPGT